MEKAQTEVKQPSIPEQEKRVLEFWKKNKIYEKSRKKNANGKKFYMMDGPPYANGHIHMGHALNKTLKDASMRAKRLQGFAVFDRAGYDTHGLPIEFQIEKEIGTKTKKDIEKFGVKKFIDKCKEYATRFISVMNSEFEDLGVWMDFENPYLTLDDGFIESIWECFKMADKKGLLYRGNYPIHICPRCETAVAFNEIEYTKIEDMSVFVKFPLKDKKNTFLIIWTTTPWTLPGNTGIMVNPNIDYQEIEVKDGKERWIMAKELVKKIMFEIKLDYKVKSEFRGKEMEKWNYENPLSRNLKLKLKNAYRVVLSLRYVTTEEGTGLVHCAPGHGKEDYEVGKENNLDMPSPVSIDGIMSEEAGKYSGKKARVVDSEIIDDLEKSGFLAYKHKYIHDYPLCWRCKSPLLMISQPQWFFRISSIQSKLLKHNDDTRWTPPWMQLRMRSWLEGISDWPVSRKRYWGTPLPIWICEKCGKKIVVGSIAELKKLSNASKIDMHKPGIDEITMKCQCGGKMKRVDEVLDVWFDSGVSSWAVLSKNEFSKLWPADLNIEGKDQIRGWWNSQMILSEIKFCKKPFENILVHGMVLDLGKKKMSKSLGNIISPQEIIDRHGRDSLRYYFAKTSKGDDFAFDENELAEVQKIFRFLANVNNFVNQIDRKKSKLKIEDKWILSRFNSIAEQAIDNYNRFRFPDAVRLIEDFLVFDFSRNYIQLIRERSEEVYDIMNEIRIGLLKLLSPIIPFLTEALWQDLRQKKVVKEESVHLSEFPEIEKRKIDDKLDTMFNDMFRVIEKGFAERKKADIGLKWPLASARISAPIELKSLSEIIQRQLNVKSLSFRKGDIGVVFDTQLTSELRAEGYSREIAREVQDMRKKSGLKKRDRIDLFIKTDGETEEMLKKHADFIKQRTNAAKFSFGEKSCKNSGWIEIKNKKVKIMFDVC